GACSARIQEQIAPFASALTLLESVPGVGRRNAKVIVAEIGVDMSVFPSSRHLASWAKLAPGNNESAGKRKSGSTGKGSPWLRSALVESALRTRLPAREVLADQPTTRPSTRRHRRRAHDPRDQLGVSERVAQARVLC